MVGEGTTPIDSVTTEDMGLIPGQRIRFPHAGASKPHATTTEPVCHN